MEQGYIHTERPGSGPAEVSGYTTPKKRTQGCHKRTGVPSPLTSRSKSVSWSLTQKAPLTAICPQVKTRPCLERNWRAAGLLLLLLLLLTLLTAGAVAGGLLGYNPPKVSPCLGPEVWKVGRGQEGQHLPAFSWSQE